MMHVFGGKHPENTGQSPKPIANEAMAKLRGGYVLLVEDNEINQIVAKEILQSMGLVVTLANNGEEAIELIKKSGTVEGKTSVSKHFDLVLMDIQMPGMDGYETTKIIRSDPRFSIEKLPIIAMTAHAMVGEREKALETGLNDYISKPIDINLLSNTLMHWLVPLMSDRQEVVVETKQNPSAANISPILEVIDMKGALDRLGNNQRLYLRILSLFRESHNDTVINLREALLTRDFVLARRLAHSLKGVAGQIGADALRATANDLEVAISEGKTTVYDPLLTEVEQMLFATLAAIAGIV